MNLLKHPLKTAKSLASARIMREFAHKFDLVYFGRVHHLDDDHQMVRGITLAADHQDGHFMVGNYKGYDITALQRTVPMSHPHHGSRSYRWTVLQVDLKNHQMPHILITAGHQDRIFFDNMRIKLATFQQVPGKNLSTSDEFDHHFKIFAGADALDDLPVILSPGLCATILQYFKHFDIEIQADQVIVYTAHSLITSAILQEMLREALWLASQLDNINISAIPEQEDVAPTSETENRS